MGCNDLGAIRLDGECSVSECGHASEIEGLSDLSPLGPDPKPDHEVQPYIISKTLNPES